VKASYTTASIRFIRKYKFIARKKIKTFRQCFGSESALDPLSMGSLIRIRIAIADPDPEGGKSAPKKKKT
jgi:hypothetical protein